MSNKVTRGTALAALLVATASATGSYGIYDSRNFTEDGGVFLDGSADEVSSHWLETVPAQAHPDGTVVRVGVDESLCEWLNPVECHRRTS